MNTQEFLTRFANVLEASTDGFDESFLLNDGNWDSLAHLAAIALVDEMYGISVPTSELVECTRVGDVVELVRRRL